MVGTATNWFLGILNRREREIEFITRNRSVCCDVSIFIISISMSPSLEFTCIDCYLYIVSRCNRREKWREMSNTVNSPHDRAYTMFNFKFHSKVIYLWKCNSFRNSKTSVALSSYRSKYSNKLYLISKPDINDRILITWFQGKSGFFMHLCILTYSRIKYTIV